MPSNTDARSQWKESNFFIRLFGLVNVDLDISINGAIVEIVFNYLWTPLCGNGGVRFGTGVFLHRCNFSGATA